MRKDGVCGAGGHGDSYFEPLMAEYVLVKIVQKSAES